MRYALVTEGGADQMLFQPINWLLDKYCLNGFSGVWANPGAMTNKSRELNIRLSQVREFYPSDLIFVHRDTDTFSYENRVDEIRRAIRDSGYGSPAVCAVPVRMTEAWFLFDESAIRRAAGKPGSNVDLKLPSHAEAQRRADPKDILENALFVASELTGRKRQQFKQGMGAAKMLVASYIGDFSPLRAHQSFAALEEELKTVIRENNW